MPMSVMAELTQQIVATTISVDVKRGTGQRTLRRIVAIQHGRDVGLPGRYTCTINRVPGSHEKYKGTKVEGVQVYRSVVHVVYMSYSPGIIYFLFDLYHSVFREVMNSTSTRVPGIEFE